jgi:hypothetical protein
MVTLRHPHGSFKKLEMSPSAPRDAVSRNRCPTSLTSRHIVDAPHNRSGRPSCFVAELADRPPPPRARPRPETKVSDRSMDVCLKEPV